MTKINWDKLSFAAFLVALCFFAALYGVYAARHYLFPMSVMNYIESVRESFGVPPEGTNPIRYNRVGATVYSRNAMAPGVTLLTSYWHDRGDLAGIRIIDADGHPLHHWTTNARKIWPDSPYKDSDANNKNGANNYVHGAILFPNGDVVFNIEYLGPVRMNACGKILWKLPVRTHHSVALDGDGSLWFSALRWIESDSPKAKMFPPLKPTYAESVALHVSRDGKILREISLLKILYDSPLRRILPLVHGEGDMLHLNRVEPLSETLAPRFPMFAAGDLLVSMRHINLVFVTSQDGTVKWFDKDDFTAQHDPHFEPDGTITVYDNRPQSETADGGYKGGSAIVSIRPDTGVLKTLYPTAGAAPFYSEFGGKQQLLPNGNRLITEVTAGRVFEIDRNGRIVWDWVQQPYNDKLVPEVMQGTRYDISPETVAGWKCD